MPENALMKGFVAAHVGEALANYALADEPLTGRSYIARREAESNRSGDGFYDDGEFWSWLIRGSSGAHQPSPTFHFHGVALSEWVARVPGLYWHPESAKLRKVRPAQIESQTSGWIQYTPDGKSQKVSGGVGTLRLPPAEDGFRLVSLPTSYNASSGVPALVSSDVWEHHGLCEGSVVEGRARWREMPQKWAVQFPVVKGLPRGCFILDELGSIYAGDSHAPIQVHPFSVMEYWDGTTRLHDFVYATADTSNALYRDELSSFFEKYRKANDRQGEYLTAADISSPMWNAVFANPEEMRTRKTAQLRLIESRVREAANDESILDALLRKLSGLPDVADLRRLSSSAGIEWRVWSAGGSLADEADRLVDAASRSGKQLPLLQAVQLELTT